MACGRDGVVPVVARRALQVARDDVPADAAVGQVVERRHAPGEGVGVLEARGHGDAEAQVLGDRGHGRHHQRRIVDRHLRAGAQRRVGRAAVDVVDAEHVGDEDAVEEPALQQPREARSSSAGRW